MSAHATMLDGRALVLMSEADRQRWLLFPWGPVAHPASDFDVTEGFAKTMLSSFAAMTADGYYPPILEEHAANGGALGLVRALSTDDEGIWGDVELAAGVADEIASGRRPYLSPSFYEMFKHPHTGAELALLLREVSLVSVPHLKNLRPLGAHYSLSESGWATTTQEAALADTDNTETPETAPTESMEEGEEMDMAQAVAELMEGYTKLSERLDNIEQMMQPEESEEEEEIPTENAETTALKRVAELERRLAIADAKTTVLAVLPHALAEEVDDLAHAIVTDSKRGTRLLSLAERAYKAEAKPTSNTVQEPIGKPGTAPAAPVDFAEAWDNISTEIGTTEGSSIIKVLQSRYPHLTGATLFE